MIAFKRRHLLATAVAASVAAPMHAPLHAEERPAVIEGARKEGKVAFANSISVAGFPKFLQAFGIRYPFIDTTSGLYSTHSRAAAWVTLISSAASSTALCWGSCFPTETARA
jgi:hypothetical protein